MHDRGKKEAEAASSQVTLTRHVDRGGCKKYGLFQNQQTDTKVLTQCLGGKKGKCAPRKKGGFRGPALSKLYRKCSRGASWKDAVSACQLGLVQYRRRK